MLSRWAAALRDAALQVRGARRPDALPDAAGGTPPNRKWGLWRLLPTTACTGRGVAWCRSMRGLSHGVPTSRWAEDRQKDGTLLLRRGKIRNDHSQEKA